jgi:hypothetical protein
LLQYSGYVNQHCRSNGRHKHHGDENNQGSYTYCAFLCSHIHIIPSGYELTSVNALLYPVYKGFGVKIGNFGEKL